MYAGWQKTLFLAKETTFGVTPSSPAPTYIYVPYQQCDLRNDPQAVVPDLYTGLYQERQSQIVKNMVSGGISLPLYGYVVSSKSIAQHLLEWTIERPGSNGLFQDSFLVEEYEGGADNKRWNGVRVASATLSGDDQGGVINLALQCLGFKETGGITTQTIPLSVPQPIEFRFLDAVLNIGGSPVTMRSFNLSINNNLQARHVADGTADAQWPSIIFSGKRRVTFSFTLYHNANTYDVLARTLGSANSVIQLVLKGQHLGTGAASTNFTTVTIDLVRASFQSKNNQAALNDLAQQSPQFIALKPDTSASEIAFTYGSAA
jgi:hypothetical protein